MRKTGGEYTAYMSISEMLKKNVFAIAFKIIFYLFSIHI